MVKSAARPETSDDTGTGTKEIIQGGLNITSLWSHPNTKLYNIPVGVHSMIGPSGKTLIWSEVAEVVDPEILGMNNSTKKVGTLLEMKS